ncbi:MAG: Crp/Fnr family transcriptional regulator [Acidobacteriota bacterium]|nr:Crp/Fnr family transcriptional regulator [Acidobacteriota bacterium]
MGAALLDRVGTLRQAALFRTFSDFDLCELAQHATVRRLRRDECLVYEGEQAKGLLILADGAVRAYREGSDGREQVLCIEQPVTTLNELQLFDGGPHPASISACEESLVLRVPFAHCRHYPHFASTALELMSERLRNAFELVHSLSLLSVEQRLARFLLEQADSTRTCPQQGLRVELTMSNQQIGAVVGAVREVVSRCLSKLHKRGLIVFSGRTVAIPDEARLNRFISSSRANREVRAAAS